MKGSFAAHHGHQERFVLGFDLFPELEEANMNRQIDGVALAAGLSSLKVNVIEGVDLFRITFRHLGPQDFMLVGF